MENSLYCSLDCQRVIFHRVECSPNDNKGEDIRYGEEIKIKALFDDESVTMDSIGGDSGLMINDRGDVTVYLSVEYADYFHVYLYLFDEREPPFRDILAS